jgi:hypothetical protein
MRKALLALAIIIATAPAGHATPQAGVRLDLPPGYLAPKPAAASQKASPAEDDCTSRCANFDDGYAWAQARSFTNEKQCHGHTRAFVEGCMIYVTDHRKQKR